MTFINEIKPFHKNVHMKIINEMEIGRNGKINLHSKWKSLSSTGVAYYQQLQEHNSRKEKEG
jgi:hypothetical protein